MPWSGGVFSRSNGTHTGTTVWAQDKAAATGILATVHDTHDQDVSDGINATLCKDGSNTPTADLPMNSHKHTGVAAATGSGMYMRYDEVVGIYQPIDATLTAFAGLTLAANEVIIGTGADAVSTLAYSTLGASILNIASKPALRALGELSQAVTASSSSLAIDMSLGWNVALTLSASVTSVTVTNWPAANTLGRLTLEITSTGAFTMAGWPGTTRWTGGTAPTITSSGKDTIVLTSSDGGTTFRGYLGGQNMS